MIAIQTRIDNLEKRVDKISTTDLSYVFISKIDIDGSTLYDVDRDSGREWVNKTEFDKYIEGCNYEDKSKPIIILNTIRSKLKFDI